MVRPFAAARPSGAFNFAFVSLALGTLGALAPSSTVHAQDRCAALKSVAITGLDVRVASAEAVAAGPPNAPPAPGGGPTAYTGPLPARCRVEGLIDPRKGVGGVDDTRVALDRRDVVIAQCIDGHVKLPLGSC